MKRVHKLCVTAFTVACFQTVLFAQQAASLEATLSLAQIGGVTVPYQNGIPLPSFKKQQRPTLSLGGSWWKLRFTANNVITLYNRSTNGFALVSTEMGGRQFPGFDDSGWETTMLPAVENRVNPAGTVPEYYESGVYYRRSFAVAESLKTQTARLNFYAVNYVCDVWMNGTFLGFHEGGYTPFAIDVTSVLRYDTANVIAVRVHTAKTDPASLTKEITAELIGDPVTLTAPAEKTMSIPADSVGVSRMDVTVAAPALWSPAKPNLYILTVTLSRGGVVVDRFSTQFGIRTVKTKGSAFLLNEQPAFLHGIARHEDHPAFGRSLPASVIYADLSAIKAMNANYVRTGQYPNHPYTYLIADRLGLAIMEEIPVWWFDDQSAWDMQNNTRHIHQQMFREMVFSDYNRPSIALWSTSNECLIVPGRTTFINTVRDELAAQFPDERLVTQSAAADRPGPADASQAECDTRGWTMYFGIFHGGTYFDGTRKFLSDAAAANPNKPIVNTEYGYWSSENGASSADQVMTFDSTYAALSLYAPIDSHGAARTTGPLMGITWWCAFDWYTHTQPRGYQSMGLMKMDRTTPKPVLSKLTAAYAKLVGRGEYITHVGPGAAPRHVPLEYSLEQNFPNPFNPSTVIRFAVPEIGHVTLTVCDVLGREVETIVDGELPGGVHAALWNTAGRPSGLYFYRLRSGIFTDTKKKLVYN